MGRFHDLPTKKNAFILKIQALNEINSEYLNKTEVS